MRNVLVYLSAPISARRGRSVERNVAAALDVYLDCVRRGIPAICVHLGAAFPSAHSIDYERWMALDFAYIDRCDAVLMFGDWRESKGAMREHDYAFTQGKPTFYDMESLVAWSGARRDQPEPPCSACAKTQEAER